MTQILGLENRELLLRCENCGGVNSLSDIPFWVIGCAKIDEEGYASAALFCPWSEKYDWLSVMTVGGFFSWMFPWDTVLQ